MKFDCFDEMKRLTSEMVAIPSVNKEPGGETEVAKYVENYFRALPYFKEHSAKNLGFFLPFCVFRSGATIRL